jgi:hypothetical protein
MAYIPQFMTIQMDNDSTFQEVKPVKPERTHNKVPGGIILRKSSLFRYVYYNLHLMDRFRSKKAGAKEVEMNVAVSDVADKQDTLRPVAKYIICTIQTELGSKNIIFVMDGPRRNIYQNDLEKSKTKHLNTMVDSITHQLNLPFIDLTPYMVKDYQQNKKRFESDYDNHWAEYGHQFVANVLYQYFKNNKL